MKDKKELKSLFRHGSPDYHDFTTKDMPQAERRKLNVGNVWINGAECLSCGEKIRSANRHDYVTCSCGNLSVDGGSWYCKRAFSGSSASYRDLSESFDDVKEEQWT